MADIFSKAFLEKIDSAIADKQGKHKEKIQVKLLELQNFISMLDQKKQIITDEDSYQKYVNFLKEAINTTIEQITAPTVEDYMVWIEQIAGSSKNSECGKFRKFLIKNYSDEISSRIDSILLAKDVLDKENMLFTPLLSEARKAVKKDCITFLDKSAEFENTIDSFMEGLDDNLSGLNEIKELACTTIEELYLDQQKQNNIDFYADIITKIVEDNQSLKSLENEKDDLWLGKLKTRIFDTKKCIKLLDDTGIAASDDETIKKLFLRFDNEMVDAKKGVVDTLDNFIENTWNEISDNYFKIKEYFENPAKITANAADWDAYPKKTQILALIENYNDIFSTNPLDTLNLGTKDISKSLKGKVKKINDYEESESKVKQEILEVFSNFTEEYEKKLPLLESLATSNNSLSRQVQEIKNSMTDLQEATKRCNGSDMISYLNDYFASDLYAYSDITNWFTEVLQKSGMTEELNWLNARLNEAEQGDISVTDFNEKVLKELLEKGLITLTITKTF